MSIVQKSETTWFGRMIRGILKLALASMLIALITALANITLPSITIGNQSVDMTVILQVVCAFAPILLIISALRDLGVNI